MVVVAGDVNSHVRNSNKGYSGMNDRFGMDMGVGTQENYCLRMG